MKSFYVLAALALFQQTVSAQTIQSWDWNGHASDFYNNSNIYQKSAVECDNTGNMIISGSTGPAENIAGINTTAYSPYLAKLDPNGNAIWVKSLYCGAINDIVCDNSGNIYISGWFIDSLNFDGTILYTSSGPSNIPYTDAIVAKFDPAGNLVWVRQGGYHGTTYTTATTKSASIALDASGNIFATGHYIYGANFGSINLPAVSTQQSYYIRYDNAGTEQWVSTASSAMINSGSSITVASSNEIYVSGWCSNGQIAGITFGSTTIYNEIYLVKLDGSGAFIWARGENSSWAYTGNDNAGNVYLLTDTLTKFNPGGNILWQKRVDGNNNTLTIRNDKLLIGTTVVDYNYTNSYGYAGLPGFTFYGPATNFGASSCVMEADTSGAVLRIAPIIIRRNYNAYSSVHNIAADNSGNIFAVGMIRDTVYFCSQQEIANGTLPPQYVHAYWAKVSATNNCALPPAPPLSLIAVSTARLDPNVVTQLNTHQITLNWTDNSNNETGFSIERTDWTGPWQVVGTVGQNITMYVDSGLPDTTFYCYRVNSYNANGNSGYSNESCDTTWVTGIHSLSYSAIPVSVFPNPSTGIVTINHPQLHSGSCANIYSASGALIQTTALTPQQQTTLDLSPLPAGLYFICISEQDAVVYRGTLVIE